MMITHPENLSKERLKTELKNHGVRYNNNENKQYYVSLYRKRVMGSDEARQEFSSDEEFSQHAGRSERKQQSPRKKKSVRVDTYLSEVQGLIDDELKEELERFGKDCGPITDTTRAVYQRMLAKLMAERVTGKSGVTQSSRGRESSDDEDEGVVQNESFVGEWSSDEDEEEEETDTPEDRRQTHIPASGKGVKVPSVRERPRRPPAKPVADPPKPARHRPKLRRQTSSSLGSSYYSFGILLVMFIIAFFAYEHYTSHEGDPSLVTKGWKEVKCGWNWLKGYIVKSKPPSATPTPTPSDAPPTPPPPGSKEEKAGDTPPTPPPHDSKEEKASDTPPTPPPHDSKEDKASDTPPTPPPDSGEPTPPPTEEVPSETKPEAPKGKESSEDAPKMKPRKETKKTEKAKDKH